MTVQRHLFSRRSIGLTITAGVALLTGCSGGSTGSGGSESIDQSVTVTYLNEGVTVETAVSIPELECSELSGTLLYTLDGENKDEEWGTLTASATADQDSYSLSLNLGDGLWFVANNPYESDESTLTLNGLEGIVMPIEFENRTPDFGTAIDSAATASGSLECTSTS
jgi:hypothetical protein